MYEYIIYNTIQCTQYSLFDKDITHVCLKEKKINNFTIEFCSIFKLFIYKFYYVFILMITISDVLKSIRRCTPYTQNPVFEFLGISLKNENTMGIRGYTRTLVNLSSKQNDQKIIRL